MGSAGPVGLDFGAAFLMADALGFSRAAIAEFLPAAETGFMRGILKQMDKGQHGEP